MVFQYGAKILRQVIKLAWLIFSSASDQYLSVGCWRPACNLPLASRSAREENKCESMRVAFYPSLPPSLALCWCDVSSRISQRWQEGLQYANATSRYVFFGACVLTRVPLHRAQRRANFGPSPASVSCVSVVFACQIIVPACIRWILMFLERFLKR